MASDGGQFVYIRVPLTKLAMDYHEKYMKGSFSECVYDTKTGEVLIETLLAEREKGKGGT